MKGFRRILLFLTLAFLLGGCRTYKYTEYTEGTERISAGFSMAEKLVRNTERERLEIHYLDVGQADAALILCGEEAMLIDGGNAEDSDFLYSYLKNHSVDRLKYIVCTHPHEDHAGGLAGALNYAEAGTALCPVTEYDSRAFRSFVKYLDRQGVSITVPVPGESLPFGGASVQVLGPISMNEEELNNTSLVLRIVYGETSFLFTGDAEQAEEREIAGAGYDMKSTVLKVGHHGSVDATSELFLGRVMPEYAVISVGADNPYGHPAEEVLNRLDAAGAKVYRTDLQGSIICVSDGKAVSFSCDPGAGSGGEAAVTGSGGEAAAAGEKAEYVLNTRTNKFHYPACPGVSRMSERNKLYFTGSREEVIAMGYEPCGQCRP